MKTDSMRERPSPAAGLSRLQRQLLRELLPHARRPLPPALRALPTWARGRSPAAQAALSRALRRLEARGLVLRLANDWPPRPARSERAGLVVLTDQGLEATQRLTSGTASPLLTVPATGAGPERLTSG